MRVLVTGGCGFLGSNVASEALRRGHELTILDNMQRVGSTANLAWLQSQGDLRFVRADIRSPENVAKVVKDGRPDVVFHLAGQVAMTTSLADPRSDFEINAGGTVNLLEAIREYASEATVIFSSTNKVYGDLEQYRYDELETRYQCIDFPRGFDESVSLSFESPYGCSKGCGDQYVLDYSRVFGLNTVVFRHSSMYGGRQFATYDQGWIGWFCEKALEKHARPDAAPFTISGSGKQVRDLLHAEDAVALYFLATEKIDLARGQAFNVGGGMENSLSVLELLSMLEGFLDVELQYQQLPARPFDQRVFVADTTKASGLLGWSPQVTAPEGVAKHLRWVQDSMDQNTI